MFIYGFRRFAFVVLAGIVALPATAADHLASDRVSDISNTKHNFAANADITLPNSAQRQVKAVSQNELCVFCHTPHGDQSTAEPFLWNREIPSTATYTYYSSDSLDAGTLTTIGKPSKMCMSCHDGTVAVGAIKVANGKALSAALDFTGNGVNANGTLKDSGSGHGNYNLGTDLSNDHPIGFIYDTTLATNDGELADPADATVKTYMGVRVGSSVATYNQNVTGTPGSNNPTTARTRIAVPLHSALSTGDGKLPSSGFAALQNAGQLECTSCHDPHIRSTKPDENIKFLRLHRFQKATPTGGTFDINNDQNCLACHKKSAWNLSVHANSTDATSAYTSDAATTRDFPAGTRVWEAGCLNCHDTHTEKGAKLLLREGANSSDASAREETCYQCHSSTGILQTAAKDIKTVINLTGGHSSISAGTEYHTVRKKSDTILGTTTVISSGNHVEKQADLDVGSGKRHVECSDCHHAHRMQRNTVFDGTSSWSDPTTLAASASTNFGRGFAKGSLRGVWGIEPTYTAGANWGTSPLSTDYSILQGDVSDTASYSGTTYVKKEYQICLKCHSTFANGTGKTDKAMEFQTNGAAGRSWHPVVGATGRSASYSTASLNAPYNTSGAAGSQVMNCSDCHASDVSNGTKGPHGSTNTGMLVKANDDNFCLTCHASTVYDTTTMPTARASGFSCANATADCVKPAASGGGTGTGNRYLNLHTVSTHQSATCDTCHVKIPHGWQVKGLLVNTNVAGGNYYSTNAKLQFGAADTSEQWKTATCTSAGCH